MRADQSGPFVKVTQSRHNDNNSKRWLQLVMSDGDNGTPDFMIRSPWGEGNGRKFFLRGPDGHSRSLQPGDVRSPVE
jgi:hypothetical protein